MKIIYTSLLTLSLSSQFAFSAPKSFSIDDVAKQVKQGNYLVLEEAERLYQARQNISVARAGLLPRLNLWKVASTALGSAIEPASLLELVPEIAPFLVPANWFRAKETEILYFAEMEGYRALWANELLQAKSLYYQILFDQNLLTVTEKAHTRLKEVETVVKARESTGHLPSGSTKIIQIKRLALEADRKNLSLLVSEEHNAMKAFLGLQAQEELELKAIPKPDYSSFEDINANELLLRVVDVAPENRQYGHFLKVLPLIKKEIRFSFLGASDISRGVAGGIFDDIPMPDGLGFGQGASLDILRSKEKIMTLQKVGIEETLKRNLFNTVSRFNSMLELAENIESRAELSDGVWKNLKRKLVLGEEVDFQEITEATEVILGVDIAVMAHEQEFLKSNERISRLLFNNDYDLESPEFDVIRRRRE